jgi:hypothetical protein
MKTIIFSLLISVTLFLGCSDNEPKKTIVIFYNTSDNYIAGYPANVQILTNTPTPDIKCKNLKLGYFGISNHSRTGFMAQKQDTIWLNCIGKNELEETNRYIDDSSYYPSITMNNFWIAKDFNYMSLSEMDSIVHAMLNSTKEIFYYTTDNQRKIISLRNMDFEYVYYYGDSEDGKDYFKVEKGDSLFYVRMKMPKPPPYPFKK